MTLNAQQRVHNIRTKVRLISDRIWRIEGWGVCTGDLERAFILREMDMLANTIEGLLEKGMDNLTMVAAFQVNEELRADNARLRAALQQIADYSPGKDTTAMLLRGHARMALEPQP